MPTPVSPVTATTTARSADSSAAAATAASSAPRPTSSVGRRGRVRGTGSADAVGPAPAAGAPARPPTRVPRLTRVTRLTRVLDPALGQQPRGAQPRTGEHEVLGAPQRLRGLHPELLVQARPGRPVHLQGPRLLSRRGEREHELGDEPLVERVRRGEGVELGHQPVDLSGPQRGVVPLLEHRQPGLAQPVALHLDGGVLGDTLQGRTREDGQRPVVVPERTRRVGGARGPREAHLGIPLVLVHHHRVAEPVAAAVGDEHRLAVGGLAPDAAHQRLNPVAGRRRRVAGPEPVAERVHLHPVAQRGEGQQPDLELGQAHGSADRDELDPTQHVQPRMKALPER